MFSGPFFPQVTGLQTGAKSGRDTGLRGLVSQIAVLCLKIPKQYLDMGPA